MAADRAELERLIRAADSAGDADAVRVLFDEMDKLGPSLPTKQTGFSPYKYYEPETQRLLGNNGSSLRPFGEVAPGFNTGVAHLAGLPMTTLTNLGNLASAGLGYAQSKITGKPPSPAFNPVDPANVPLTGAWNEKMLNKSPMGDVTSVRNPGDPVARIVHSASAGIPGGIVGGGPVAPNAVAGIAGGAAGAALNEAGADPATQAVGSLLGGYGASRMSFPPPRAPQPKPEPVPSTLELRNAKAAAYKAADDAGVVIRPESTTKVVRMIEGVAKKENLGKLPPKIKEAHDILSGRIKSGEPLSLADADKVRQIIGDAMRSQDAADVRLAAVIRKEYDNYLDNLSVADTLAGDGQAGAALLRNARDLNRRFKNSEMFDEMLDKASVDADAKYTQAGLEHALRLEFKKLYKSDIDDGFLTPAQKAAVRRVAAPGRGANTLRNIGKLDVTRGGMSAGLSTLIGGGLGAVVGSLAGPAGAGAGALAGQLLVGGGAAAANSAALKGTQNRVNLAREALVGRGLLATGGTPATQQSVPPSSQATGLPSASQAGKSQGRRSVAAIQQDIQRLSERARFELANEPANSPRIQLYKMELARLQSELATTGAGQ